MKDAFLKCNLLMLVMTLSIQAVYAGGKRSASNHQKIPIHYAYGDVIDSQPIFETRYTRQPRQSCWFEDRVVRHSSASHSSATGTVLGGIIGAAIGNELGHKKRNKQVGAVAGAILGSSIGRDVSRRHSAPAKTTYEQVEQCQVVHERHQEQVITGYHVLYHYNGDEYRVRMPYEPGHQIKLRVKVDPVI